MNEWISQFIEYMAVERGLSTNTLQSYQRDLTAFAIYLDRVWTVGFAETKQSHIIAYLAYLRSLGRANTTVSRNLASIRSLFHFLLKEEMLVADPTSQVETPKVEKRLPKVLTIVEVERLLNAPDDGNPVGSRDKAMLELLYATGIRVSELVSLQVGDLNLSAGFKVSRQGCQGKNHSHRGNCPTGIGQLLAGWSAETASGRRLQLTLFKPSRFSDVPPGILEDSQKVRACREYP